MSDSRKKIVILGATGSIGDNTLKVVRQHRDKLQIVGVACDRSYQKLAAICEEFQVPQAAIYNEQAYQEGKQSSQFANTELLQGLDGLKELSRITEADTVLVAVVGTTGLLPALEAVRSGKDLALASKEILVMAGRFFTEEVKKANVRLLPVDSEHNAIFQCLHGEARSSLEYIILTASGGMFRDRDLNTFDSITPEEAVQHPNWSMGKKITVDSATMANKGLEVIEAHWLFELPGDKIKVMVHPESIIHSLVEFVDGSILAQMSPPSMTFAIQHALLYPERAQRTEPSLNFRDHIRLDLRPPDLQRYPCLRLAYESLNNGGTSPAAFNAANEVAVEAFLNKQVGFTQIPEIIERTLENTQYCEPQTLDEVIEADSAARGLAKRYLQ